MKSSMHVRIDVTPFDLANVVLVLCMLYVSANWKESV